MFLLDKAFSGIIRNLPVPIKSLVLPYYAPAMLREIRDLLNTECSTIRISGQDFPALKFPDGTILVGQRPTAKEVALFASTFNRIGIPKDYICMGLDYVTRYKHPHMAAGFDRLAEPKNQRRYFHPQHFNLAQECNAFPESLKETIKKVFSFQKNWNIVDVGCYIGYGSLWAKNMAPDGRVISVEAIKENFDIASSICSINKIKNWDLVNAAIWYSDNETLEISRTVRQANALDSKVVGGEMTSKIKTISIPALMEMCEGRIDLLSLTVNGAEVEAIKGLERANSSELPRRVLTPGWYKKDDVVRADIIEPMLSGMGYRTARTPGNFVYAWLV